MLYCLLSAGRASALVHIYFAKSLPPDSIKAKSRPILLGIISTTYRRMPATIGFSKEAGTGKPGACTLQLMLVVGINLLYFVS